MNGPRFGETPYEPEGEGEVPFLLGEPEASEQAAEGLSHFLPVCECCGEAKGDVAPSYTPGGEEELCGRCAWEVWE